MKTIEKILVAVPTDPEYRSVVRYAIGMAQDLRAQLTVVLTYNWVPAHLGDSEVDAAYERACAKAGFEQFVAQTQQGTLPDYHLVSMDGPLCEAILAASPTYHPNLVITTTDQQHSLADLVQRIPDPLLLVPPGVPYRPIKRVGLAYDTTPGRRSDSVVFVDQLAQACGAEVEVLELGTANQLASQAANQANVALESLLESVTHRFHFSLGEGTADEMKHYVEEYHPHVLVVLARQQLPHDVDPRERHTVALAKVSPVPVLVLKS